MTKFKKDDVAVVLETNGTSVAWHCYKAGDVVLVEAAGMLIQTVGVNPDPHLGETRTQWLRPEQLTKIGTL